MKQETFQPPNLPLANRCMGYTPTTTRVTLLLHGDHWPLPDGDPTPRYGDPHRPVQTVNRQTDMAEILHSHKLCSGGSRISPRRGCQLPGGYQNMILPNFLKNCIKLKEFGRPSPPALRSGTAMYVRSKN